MRKVLDTKISNPVETDAKTKYLSAIEEARKLFHMGKLEKLEFVDPDEPEEVHIMQLFIRDNGDFDGSGEIEIFSKLLSYFDYVTFEIINDDQIMIGCMINGVYVEA